MHRNTYLLVVVLSICAALLVGVNIGKRLKPPTVATPAPPAGGPTPVIIMQTYTDAYCGFSLVYPSTFTVLENASGSAILHNPLDKTQSITLTCQKAIPQPALTADKIETFTIPDAGGSSISAKLYHESSAEGATIDAVIFRHPGNGMDSFVAGYGDAFDTAIRSLRILP